MPITYEPLNPPIIENTVMRKLLLDGVLRTYRIAPAEGYVLHDKAWDSPVLDDEGNETGEAILGYQVGEASCGFNYDFSTRLVTAIDGSTVTAYGSREFYAIPRNLVPENQIYGSTPSNPPAEVV
jgi:hypothetical protein